MHFYLQRIDSKLKWEAKVIDGIVSERKITDEAGLPVDDSYCSYGESLISYLKNEYRREYYTFTNVSKKYLKLHGITLNEEEK